MKGLFAEVRGWRDPWGRGAFQGWLQMAATPPTPGLGGQGEKGGAGIQQEL